MTKVLKLASKENIFYEHPESSRYENIKLKGFVVIAVIFFVSAAWALLYEWWLEFGGVGIYGS